MIYIETLNLNSFFHSERSYPSMRGGTLSIKCCVPHFRASWIALGLWQELLALRRYQSGVHWRDQGLVSGEIIHLLHNWLFAQDLAFPDNVEPLAGYCFLGWGSHRFSNRHRCGVWECAWAFLELWNHRSLSNYLWFESCCLFLLLVQKCHTLRAQRLPLERWLGGMSWFGSWVGQSWSSTWFWPWHGNLDTAANLGAWSWPEVLWLLKVLLHIDFLSAVLVNRRLRVFILHLLIDFIHHLVHFLDTSHRL